MPTTFLRVVGLSDVTVKASAEAERRPLSVAMVLDVTESLGSTFNGVDAIGYLRNAAGQFVGYFDDDMDKMSLTAFSTGTVLYSPLDHSFTSRMTGTIQEMTANNFTNLSDGLISGREQLHGDLDRSSFKALVFFTDGRPTALRTFFPINGTNVDAVITGKQDPVTGSVYDQLYRVDKLHEPILGVSYTAPEFPNGLPKTVANLQSQANQNLRQAAAAARHHDITIFTIGLGNPRAAESYKQPDARLLIEIANAREGVVDGETIDNPSFDPEQPEGRFYFAPDADQLDAIFEQVAREIVLRLTQ